MIESTYHKPLDKRFDNFSRLFRDEHSVGDAAAASSVTAAISTASIAAALIASSSVTIWKEHLIQGVHQRLSFVKGTIFCLDLNVHLKLFLRVSHTMYRYNVELLFFRHGVFEIQFSGTLGIF